MLIYSAALLMLMLLFAAAAAAAVAAGTALRIPLTRVTTLHQHANDVYKQLLASSSSSAAAMCTLFDDDCTTTSNDHDDNTSSSVIHRINLQNYRDRMYRGPILVGTPVQQLNVVYDTGSTDMWLFSAASDNGGGGKDAKPDFIHYFNESASQTCSIDEQSDTSFTVKYGKGEVLGHIDMDVVEFSDLHVYNMSFGVVTRWSRDFDTSELPLDGIVGLAFSSASGNGLHSIVDELQVEGMVQRRLFAFYLDDDPNSTDGSDTRSYLEVGDTVLTDIPSQYVNEPHVVANVIERDTIGMWMSALDGVIVGDSLLSDVCSSTSSSNSTSQTGRQCGVLFDSGSSFIGVTESLYDVIAAEMIANRDDCDASEGLIVCEHANDTRNLPSFGVHVNGLNLVLNAADLMLGNVVAIQAIGASTKHNLDLFILGKLLMMIYLSVRESANTFSALRHNT